MIDIRRARADDNAAINTMVSRVVNATYAGQWKPGAIDIGEDDGSPSWIAIADGAIAGAVMTELDWITNLWVDHAHHRRGIGRALMATAERELVERGIAEGLLRVVSTNSQAIAFYDALGWRRSHEIIRPGIPVPMIVFAKRLS